MTTSHTRSNRSTLHLHQLEGRDCPALTLQFDYSLDSSGFFNDFSRRQTLEAAGAQLVSRVESSLAAINPSGNNNWQAVLTHPSTGGEVRLPNLRVAADTLIVYAGGMNLNNLEAGLGGPGGFWVSGARAFQSNVATRGQSSFGPWGGSVSFDLDTNWYFGLDPNGRQPGQLDFHTVATHELGHVLGFGTSSIWFDQIQGGQFTGANVSRLNGGPVRLSADQAHFTQQTLSNGNPVSMRPIMDSNSRVGFTELDYAALADVGWRVAGVNAELNTLPTTPIGTAIPGSGELTTLVETGRIGAITQAISINHPPLNAPASQISVVSNPTNGTVQVFTSTTGRLTAAGTPFQPFIGFLGEVRSTVADVNGDGVGDLVLGTGPGGGSRIRLLDGQTFTDIVPEFIAFESRYTGGVFVAAADLDRDGRAEVIITPDQGGGGRVQIIKSNNGAALKLADFFGIDDPNFRGGARASAGDLNGDGIADLVVAAGFGGGPRVAVFDGSSLTGQRRYLVPDFFAFEPSLRNGAYVTIGDLEGNGTNDLIFGAGPGGAPRVLAVNSTTLLTQGSTTALSQPTANGFVGDISQRGGVRVAVKDLDGTGKKDLVTGSGESSEVRVTQVNSGSFVPQSVFSPFGSITETTDGVYVG